MRECFDETGFAGCSQCNCCGKYDDVDFTEDKVQGGEMIDKTGGERMSKADMTATIK